MHHVVFFDAVSVSVFWRKFGLPWIAIFSFMYQVRIDMGPAASPPGFRINININSPLPLSNTTLQLQGMLLRCRALPQYTVR
jgi:hypothetical protein